MLKQINMPREFYEAYIVFIRLTNFGFAISNLWRFDQPNHLQQCYQPEYFLNALEMGIILYWFLQHNWGSVV